MSLCFVLLSIHPFFTLIVSDVFIDGNHVFDACSGTPKNNHGLIPTEAAKVCKKSNQSARPTSGAKK